MAWTAFRELYEAERLAGKTEGTQAKAGGVFDSFEQLAAPRTLGAITERTISQYAAKLQGNGRSPATIRGHLAYLREALRWAKGQKLIAEVPAIVMPKLPKGASRAKVRAAAKITTEAFERLLMKCSSDGWRLLVALAWHCGLRRLEARRVEGRHVDLQAHTIAIPRNKAGDEAATVFITPELDAMLRERWPVGDLPDGELISPGEVASDPESISKEFQRVARRAAVKGGGKDGYCTLHDLRRSFGSRWAAKVPAQVLQRLMRHADIKTTMDFYADVEQAALGLLWPAETRETRERKPAPKPAPDSAR